MNKQYSWLIATVIVVVIILAVIYNPKHKTTVSNTPTQQTNEPPDPVPTPTPASVQVVSPIGQADRRVTKKPFGIYITPKTSPVQPEKFMGYHTGTDFETFASEADANVPIFAICSGKILIKRFATGYGGVFVQSCTINNQAVTIIYGHVKLTSIAKNIGDTLTQGEQIGFLGQPPSETDGERKHLHLGIHIGTTVNILGYVQKQSELAGWLDFQKL